MFSIPAEAHLAVFAALMAISGLAFVLEKTRLGAQITGTVMVILLVIFASNIGVLPHSAPAYDFIFEYVVPCLIPLFLFQADIRRVLREATRTALAFSFATVGTVLGVILAATLLDLSTLASAATTPPEQREAAIAGLFASTYIGGSVNYAALGEMTGLRSDASFFSAATAADNLFSALYLSLLALLPGVRWLVQRFQAHVGSATTTEEQHAITPQSLTLALATAMGLVVVTDWLVLSLEIASARYLVLTTLTLLLATGLPQCRRWFAGGFELGITLSFTFFAAIAAGADIPAMIQIAPLLIAVVCILLTTHLVVTLVLGKLFKLSLPELITASNAAILGATTAPVLAAAKGWHDQVVPGVLVGVMGYALGTFIGATLYQAW